MSKFNPPGGSRALACLLCLLLLTSACARTGPAGEAYEALVTEYRGAIEDTDTRDAYAAVVGDYTPRFEALADTYWGTEGGLDAELWLLGMVGVREQDAEARTAAQDELLEAIFARYARSPLIAKVADYFYYASGAIREKYFLDLQENSRHPGVRAAFLYSAARSAEFDLTYGRGEIDREALTELRRTNLQRLVDEYHDVPLENSTYGTAAELMLSAHDPSALEIGRPAPEIIGTDVDGHEMKLSDYHGKVVFIDFWGDW